MMWQNLWHLVWGFFVANVLGYGGGPSSIPLMEAQIVDTYHWLNETQFTHVLALANALPGPIATKIATYVGYGAGGWAGMLIANVATVVPSAVAVVLLLRLLNRYRQSDVVRGMTLLVQPVIAVMMALLTWQIGRDSVHMLGWWQALIIAAVAYLLMERLKVHPALVILAAFVYGGIVVR
ncbi:MAG: chromate transporter [Thermoflavifilum sp.]|nr:chromate transporter [Thermoflavifilum sp.]MCL6513854.1 chromate transporter [Alicyclobacillus sp.]